jgi:hypothetical protein
MEARDMDTSNVENADPAGASQGATSVFGTGPGGKPPAFDGLAAAVLDDRGTVVGWTCTAQELTGVCTQFFGYQRTSVSWLHCVPS